MNSSTANPGVGEDDVTTGQHDHDHDHDHDAADQSGALEGHKHPPHGIRGGHLIQLSEEKEVEVLFSKKTSKLTVHVSDAAEPDTVSSVKLTIESAGETSDYQLQKAETDTGTVYEITSDALATGLENMGDSAKATLTISTTNEDISGVYTHHAH